LAAQRDATMTRGLAKVRLTAERSPAAWMTQGTIAPRHPASAEAGYAPPAPCLARCDVVAANVARNNSARIPAQALGTMSRTRRPRLHHLFRATWAPSAERANFSPTSAAERRVQPANETIVMRIEYKPPERRGESIVVEQTAQQILPRLYEASVGRRDSRLAHHKNEDIGTRMIRRSVANSVSLGRSSQASIWKLRAVPSGHHAHRCSQLLVNSRERSFPHEIVLGK
jgi:hypothetical protein